MPIETMSNCKFGIMIDGEFKELLHSIEQITLIPEHEVIESFKMTRYKSESFSFSFKSKNIDFKRMIRNAIYGSNNWRKLHRLLMIRKENFYENYYK